MRPEYLPHCVYDPRFLEVDMINRGPLSTALEFLPETMDTLDSRALLLKIGLQESKLVHRRQLVGSPPRPTGPAAGLWQFERGGGIKGCMTHPATSGYLRSLCAMANVPFDSRAIWEAIQHDDVLAAGLARLNLWWSPRRLPSRHSEQAGWDEYIFCWRPGKPHRITWGGYHQIVNEYIKRTFRT